MDGRIVWIGNWCTLNTNIFLAVSKCSAAGQGLEWTKCRQSDIFTEFQLKDYFKFLDDI